jgi:beta-glucanase (GH16 family)
MPSKPFFYRIIPFFLPVLLSLGIPLVSCGPAKLRPIVSTDALTNLVWADEFDGTKIDLSNWSYETERTGWRKSSNNELQDYIDDGAGGPNAFVSNGLLIIRALNPEPGKYTSARLVTQNKRSFLYGLIAARIRLPYGNGIWPAFWMLGENFNGVNWPYCGEIDIAEMIGGSVGRMKKAGDNVNVGSLHGPGYAGQAGYHARYRLTWGNFKDDFHVFAVSWNTNGISWFVDGVNYLNVPKIKFGWVFYKELYILLNLAVGGHWPGPPDETTVFPQEMAVDWVRVYR